MFACRVLFVAVKCQLCVCSLLFVMRCSLFVAVVCCLFLFVGVSRCLLCVVAVAVCCYCLLLTMLLAGVCCSVLVAV